MGPSIRMPVFFVFSLERTTSERAKLLSSLWTEGSSYCARSFHRFELSAREFVNYSIQMNSSRYSSRLNTPGAVTANPEGTKS